MPKNQLAKKMQCLTDHEKCLQDLTFDEVANKITHKYFINPLIFDMMDLEVILDRNTWQMWMYKADPKLLGQGNMVKVMVNFNMTVSFFYFAQPMTNASKLMIKNKRSRCGYKIMRCIHVNLHHWISKGPIIERKGSVSGMV